MSFIFCYVAPGVPTCLFSRSFCDLQPQASVTTTSSLHTLPLYTLSCRASYTPLACTGVNTGSLGLLGECWAPQLVHKSPQSSVWRIPFTWLISSAHQTYAYATGCPNPTFSWGFQAGKKLDSLGPSLALPCTSYNGPRSVWESSIPKDPILGILNDRDQ